MSEISSPSHKRNTVTADEQHLTPIYRTAVDNDGVLDKEATSYNDIFDAFRLALKFYHFEEGSSD
jgi:hypothetical protein